MGVKGFLKLFYEGDPAQIRVEGSTKGRKILSFDVKNNFRAIPL